MSLMSLLCQAKLTLTPSPMLINAGETATFLYTTDSHRHNTSWWRDVGNGYENIFEWGRFMKSPINRFGIYVNRNDEYRLSIKNITMDEAGTYQYRETNLEGKDEFTSQLIVMKEDPNITTSIAGIDDSRMTINVTFEYRGNPMPMIYINWYVEYFINSIEHVLDDHGTIGYATISITWSLEMVKTIQFQICARNLICFPKRYKIYPHEESVITSRDASTATHKPVITTTDDNTISTLIGNLWIMSVFLITFVL